MISLFQIARKAFSPNQMGLASTSPVSRSVSTVAVTAITPHSGVGRQKSIRIVGAEVEIVSGWYSGACSDGSSFFKAQPARLSEGAAIWWWRIWPSGISCRSHSGVGLSRRSDRAIASFGSGYAGCGQLDGGVISYSFSPRRSSVGTGRVGDFTGPGSPEPDSAGRVSAPRSASS